MIEERICNIFEQPEVTHLLHQCNLFHTFGAGIAREILDRYPEAYEADLKTQRADLGKLGTFSMSSVPGRKSIINLYSQIGIGGGIRQTDYNAMEIGFLSIKNLLSRSETPVVLGIPWKIGCGLANGDWSIVNDLICDVFDDAPFNVVICRLQSAL